MTAALIAKLESASEGSRELDAEVCDALNWRKTDGFWVYPANVTESIDAALALATRLMPGLDIDLELRPAPEGLTTDAIIYSHGYSPTPEVSWRGWASSPALAICAALLRASAAEGAGHG